MMTKFAPKWDNHCCFIIVDRHCIILTSNETRKYNVAREKQDQWPVSLRKWISIKCYKGELMKQTSQNALRS